MEAPPSRTPPSQRKAGAKEQTSVPPQDVVDAQGQVSGVGRMVAAAEGPPLSGNDGHGEPMETMAMESQWK